MQLVTMQLVASLLLFQAGALAASNAARAPAFPSQFSPAMQLRSDLAPRQTSCDGQECADGCIPLDAMCCDITVGIYCEAGTTCTTRNTCCADGLTCNTDVTNDGSCASDETRCGSTCMPKGAECCDTSLGSYCYEGTTCLSSTTCDLSGGSNNDNSSSDDSSSSSDNSSNSNDNSNSNSNSDSNSNSNNNGGGNGNSNNQDGAGFSVGPSVALVVLGAAFTLFL